MVAIKKIPLSTLAGVSGDHKSSGTTTATATQSDVDYYMACIADYTKDNGYHNINMNMNLNTDNANGHDNKDNNNNNNNNTSMMNGVHLGSRDSSTAFWDREGGSRHAQTEIRISTKIGKPTRHRDRIVQCLGCHPTENELWVRYNCCPFVVGALILGYLVTWGVFDGEERERERKGRYYQQHGYSLKHSAWSKLSVGDSLCITSAQSWAQCPVGNAL
ncbi:hypothetical protein B0O80DRAFT_127545 [Mortierella sp. GBAus27b]|nr:hypothetical protein B0O80DRAFT_127545 [Mortierella sp. GBAus27b]